MGEVSNSPTSTLTLKASDLPSWPIPEHLVTALMERDPGLDRDRAEQVAAFYLEHPEECRPRSPIGRAAIWDGIGILGEPGHGRL